MIVDYHSCLKLITTIALSLLMIGELTAQVEAQVDSFELTSIDGTKLSVEATDEASLTVLYFTGIECPLAGLYAPRVAALAKEHSDSTRFIGISSNQQDSAEEFKQFVKSHKIGFPCGKDFNNVVADQLDVKRTPEVIVLDQEFNIQYRGRVDDQFSPGVARAAVKRHDLRIAIDELLADKKVSKPRTAPEGCLLGRVKKPVDKPTVTYANQISRIFQNNCVQCHRAGEIGPFVLDDFEEAVGWGDMIVETVDNGRMPPWHADPNHGSFLNERRLSDAEKNLIRQWVADGTPFGDASDLPEKPTFTAGWQLPKKPDFVVEMRKRPFTIPADGTVDYQFFVVDPKFKEDKWVSAAEVVPGNRGVVHHSIVFIRPPDGTHMPDLGWLGAYVPGQKNLKYNPTRARFVPAGSKLVFQQHYTPNGTEQTDITKVGLVFADAKEVTDELQTFMAINRDFEIKPHEAAHKVNARLRGFPRNATLLSISPHMHFRGKSFTAKVYSGRGRKSKPDTESGKQEGKVLLSVPEYDFNWQHIYQLSEPIPLAGVRAITAEIVFDNSAANPFNPDPEKHVTWGDQTWEEMAIGFFDVSIPLNPVDKDDEGPSVEDVKERAKAKLVREAKIKKLAQDYFDRFDADKDGIIMKSELPLALQTWRAYSKLNTDGKRGLSAEEVTEAARQRIEDRD